MPPDPPRGSHLRCSFTQPPTSFTQPATSKLTESTVNDSKLFQNTGMKYLNIGITYYNNASLVPMCLVIKMIGKQRKLFRLHSLTIVTPDLENLSDKEQLIYGP